jgi:hypothetical protein
MVAARWHCCHISTLRNKFSTPQAYRASSPGGVPELLYKYFEAGDIEND